MPCPQVGSLLSALYSQLGRKVPLDQLLTGAAEKRRLYDAAQRRHHDTLHRACTIKWSIDEREKVAAADTEAQKARRESELRRLELRQARTAHAPPVSSSPPPASPATRL